MPQPRTHRTLTRLRRTTSVAAGLALVATPLLQGNSPQAPEPVLSSAAPVTPHIQSLPVPADRTAPTDSAAEDSGALRAEMRTMAAESGPKLVPVAHLEAPTTRAYSMVGVTWDDPNLSADLHVLVRTRADRGWTEWTPLEPDEDHAPSETERDGARGGTAPLWVGDSRGVQVQVFAPKGAPRGLEVNLIDPGSGPATLLMSSTMATMPRIITRRQWGADPSLRDGCWKPIHGPTVEGVVVHHTVNSNSYTKDQSDDIVRGIYAYHTQSQGWCDIGYNFLIDRYGQIFEGRAGGIRTPVRGAHAGVTAVNKYTTGVATIGNFETGWPTAALKNALVDFVTWRVQTYYRDPSGTTVIGGIRYPVIAGHRNIHSTACPGQHLYDWLPTLRQLVAQRIGDDRSAIFRRWQRLGGESASYGAPYVGERELADGRVTEFDRGDVYWSAPTGAHGVFGGILGHYRFKGGPTGKLGFPTSDERDAVVDGGRFNNFQRGSIYWSSKTGAHSIFAGINAVFNRAGGAAGIGLPITDEQDAGVPGSRMSTFQRGGIYWSSATGAHLVFAGIYRTYLRLGGPEGIGLPTSGEQDAGVPGSRMSTFQRGNIYWSGPAGAHGVYGAIKNRYLRLGGPVSDLGLPTTDEYAIPGGRQNDFEHGSIRWSSVTRRTTVTVTHD